MPVFKSMLGGVGFMQSSPTSCVGSRSLSSLQSRDVFPELNNLSVVSYLACKIRYLIVRVIICLIN